MFKIKYLQYIAAVPMLTITPPTSAQSFPVKPVRFVLGPAPDMLPRLVGQKLFELWGQQVVIDQRPGAGGIVAAELAAKSAADGYTWLLTTGSFYVLDALYPKLSYNMVRDFAPVTLMATIPFVFVTHPSLPVKSLADLVSFAKAQPGKLNYASSGTGTTAHLAAELFKLSTGVNVVHVPYKGVAPAVTDVLAGQVQMMFVVAQGAVPHVVSGKLRALAITSKKRALAVPDVPTIAEAGYPDIDMVGWNGVSVPIQTPRALIDKLNTDIRKALNQKDLQERMPTAGFDAADTSIAQFDAFIKKDVALYERIVKASKIKLD